MSVAYQWLAKNLVSSRRGGCAGQYSDMAISFDES